MVSSELAKLKIRAYATTKQEAFSAQHLFGARNLREGDLSITPEEQQLIDIYHELGRPDLANCIQHGRKYGLLNETLLGPAGPKTLNALCRCLGTNPLARSATKEEIEESGRVLFKGDERFQRLQMDLAAAALPGGLEG